jgi:molecular chaperone GrpE
MADEKPTAAAPDPDAEATAPAPEALVESRGETPPPTAEDLAEAKSRLLRTLADMENLRRRTEREMADARQYAISNFAREVLTVGDNLRRTIQAVPPEARDDKDKTLAALIEGVEVTERGLEQTLARFGVRRMEARGQKFDPAVHHAMLEIATDATPPGTVAEEIAGGYMLGDRVLRPAMVAIAKRASGTGSGPNGGAVAGEKPPAESPSADEEDSSTDAAEAPSRTG